MLPQSMRRANTWAAEGPSYLSKEGLDGFLEKHLRCPVCQGRLTGSAHGYSCDACAATYSRVGSYVDFLGSDNPLLAKVETNFANEYEVEITPYWEALCEVTGGIEPDVDQLVCSDERLFVGRAVGEMLPFGDAVFDLVLIHSVLDHCFNYGRALDEAVRVLTRGGW